jgi:hypothetical protein
MSLPHAWLDVTLAYLKGKDAESVATCALQVLLVCVFSRVRIPLSPAEQSLLSPELIALKQTRVTECER